MKASRASLLACAAATLVAAAGCYGPVVPTFHQPGVYKGATDSLLKMHATAEQKETLQKRFAMGQTDR